uniref:Uncharacterized protein n=1 Tax=Sparus aurata TaxID=8175 RepID=A0A671YM13_SPAAU
MSASDTPKSRLETRSFPPVSTPAPPPPPAAPLKPLKPLSNMSCCHLSGSCLGLRDPTLGLFLENDATHMGCGRKDTLCIQLPLMLNRKP